MKEHEHYLSEQSLKILDLDKYRLKMKLKDAGVEWHEDQKGKFKIWVRLAQATRM